VSQILPKGKTSIRTVELSGGSVEIRSLTLTESRIAGEKEGEERVVASIAFAAGIHPDDVRAWLTDTPAGDVVKLLNAITSVSGLSGEAQFRE
jgi:hypothetical protein